jgi:hypothetical protein
LVKALETGRVRHRSGILAHYSSVATVVVTMDRVCIGKAGSKSSGKGGDSEQNLHFSRPFSGFRLGCLQGASIRLSIRAIRLAVANVTDEIVSGGKTRHDL